MKSKISVLFFLFLVINGYAQKPNKGNKNEPIIIYDTISVYDTLVVYDTVKVYNKTFFQDANTVEKAVLTIDTASKKTSVSLFFEKDTATLSINSIILSENNKNLDTMKKKILTLLGAALLTQASVSQTITDSTTTVNTTENTIIAQNAQNVEKVVFKNKNSEKKYEVALPSTHTIKFQNQKFKKKYLRHRPTHLFSFNKSTNLITHIDSTFVTIKFPPPIKRRTMGEDWKDFKEYQKTRKNRKKETLEEMQEKYFAAIATYTDSVSIPIDAIKSIRFSKKIDWTKKWNVIAFVSTIAGVLVINNFVLELMVAGVITSPASVAIIAGTIATEIVIAHYIRTKKIELNKWEIVTQ